MVHNYDIHLFVILWLWYCVYDICCDQCGGSAKGIALVLGKMVLLSFHPCFVWAQLSGLSCYFNFQSTKWYCNIFIVSLYFVFSCSCILYFGMAIVILILCAQDNCTQLYARNCKHFNFAIIINFCTFFNVHQLHSNSFRFFPMGIIRVPSAPGVIQPTLV